jgi:class 3 adenylate cyclase/predicted ATPase
MRCTKCGTESTTRRKFCAACGSPLSRRCPKCSAENAPTSAFCEDCGSALAGNTASAPVSSPQAASTAPNIRVTPEQPDALASTEGERKTVTALFADIKGSMELIENLDPEEARAIVDPALKLMMDAVHHYGGYVAQSTGDGIFALFGAPAAHEDHPQCALYAALRMLDEMRRYSTKLREAGNLPIEARIGVNTGEVVVRSIATGEGHAEYTPIGHSTSLAARMQALAPTGSIAIADATRKLCEGYFTFKPLGPTRVKGVSEAVNVYEVTGLGPLRTRLQRAVGRGLTKFVGREREMEALRHAEDLAQHGHGQIVAAIAEPGVGKSRLFFEFKVKNRSGWMVLEAFSVSHGKATAYLPVLELLNSYFAISDEDDAHKRREKIRGRVLTLDRALEDTVPYLFALLGLKEGDDPLIQMDAQVLRRRMHEAIKRILLRESLNHPLLVTFEDLHWIDGETQALLNVLVDSIGTSRIVLLVSYRPEYQHQWGSRTYYTQLRLDPLGRGSAEELLTSLLGDGNDLAPLKRLIIEKTEGTPFFMEETVQVLLDGGALVRNGTVKLTKPLAELKIPPTVQAILASRIDRLPFDAKELLQTLAVIGREFPLSLIRAVVTKSDDEINRLLNDLQLGEFIYEQPALGDTEYMFKHALVRDAAYASLLRTTRRQLHSRIADALKAQFPDTAALDPELLARHYTEAGRALDGIEYWLRAGRRAAERSANQEAIGHLRNGLRLCETLPESTERSRRELALQQALSGPLMATTGWGSEESARTYARARELCAVLGETEQLFPVFVGQWINHLSGGELQTAREVATQFLSLAEQHGDTAAIMNGHRMLGWTALLLGDLAEVRPNIDKALELYVPEKHGPLRFRYVHDGRVAGYCCLVCYQWLTGFPEQAVATGEAAIGYGRHLKQANTLTFALFQVGLLAAMEGDALAAERCTKELLALSHEQGFRLHEIWGQAIAGWAIGKLGRRAEGMSQLRQAIQSLMRSGRRVYLPIYLGLLAELQIESGELDSALQSLETAKELIERTHEKWWQPDLHRLAGEASLARGPGSREDAETHFREAFDLARAAGAKSLQLRAAIRLARLMNERGQRADAHALLDAIYRQFSEGFGTVDLLEAQALLRSIS